MLVQTLSNNSRKVRRTNATDNGFPSKLITATKPTGIGDSAAQATESAIIFDGSNAGAATYNAVVLQFFGAGANNNTFSARVIGWSKLIEDGNVVTQVWVPTDLCELAVTLSSTLVGLAGKTVVATDLFADTIALTGTTANDDVSIDIVSPANDRPAHVVLDIKGFQIIEVTFTTGASATDCNGLFRFI